MHPGEEAGLIPREYDGDTQSPDFEWNNDDDSSNNNNNHPPPIRPWARLVAVERSNPDIELLEDDTIVGRGADPNGNRKVSKFHCRIYKDSSGHISVSNLSRNGTLVNGSLLENDKCRTFLHGDEIVLGPLTSGIPQYIFHILNKGSQGAIIDRKRSSEFLDIDTQLESTKRLKLSKVKDDFKCCICLSIWHDVVSVAPCLHNFCNGCFSEWYKNDKLSRCKCPQCREPVVFVKRNHTLSNIIEDYLQEFPSLKRSAEEIARLDHIAIVRNNFVKIGSGGGYESSTSEDDEDEEWDLEHCPQCPRPNVLADGAFHCGPQTLHLACTACNALMPERSDTNVPQKCVGCFQVFCGLYWCSQNISRPNGVLINCTKKKMSERTITEIPDGTFQGNVYERDVTKRYIQEQRLQIQNVVHEWLGKMDRGETDKPELPGSRQTSFTSESYFCNQCANTIVQHLLYKFRLSLPKNELPPEAAGREDCWYGRLCRTQVHKDSHARKYNHACEPSSRTRHS